MTKDQEYKLLFENWKQYVQENDALKFDVPAPTELAKTSQQEKQDLIDFIDNNKASLTADKVISHLKNNYEGFDKYFSQSEATGLSSAIDSILSKQSSMSYADKSNIESLATSILSKIDDAYSRKLYTDEPGKSAKDIEALRTKAQEKFALGDRTLSAGEMAAFGGALAAVPVAKAVGKTALSAVGEFIKEKVWDKLWGRGRRKKAKKGKEEEETNNLIDRFGPGAVGGAAAAKAIKKVVGEKGLKWAAAKQFGKRAIAFLGPIGAVAGTAWLLKDLYDAYYKSEEGVNENTEVASQLNQEEINQKIKSDIEQLRADTEFWDALTSGLDEEIKKAQKQLKRKISISKTGASGQKIKGDEIQRADALWSLVSQIAKEKGVDPKLVMGIIHTENRFQNLSNNWGSGYMALTSIARKDARLRGGADISNSNKMEPEANIRAGVALIKLIQSDLERALRRVEFDITDDDMIRLILYSYNRGVGAVVDGKGVPIGSPGKGKKYKHAGSKVFEKGLKEFNNIDDFIKYARSRYAEVLHGDYADRALRFANSYTPPSNGVS